MPKITVTFDEMSQEEAKAWVHAIADKYGTDLVMGCLKEREQRFDVTSGNMTEIFGQLDQR